MRSILAPLWLGAMLLHSACGDCTLLPCPGMAVQLRGAIPAEYTVTLTSPSEPLMSRTCSPTTPCSGNRVQFPGYAPDVVTVAVVSAVLSHEVTVQPAYETVYPNGPDCGPSCRGGTVMLEL